jgi:hypothetical protein
MSTAEEDGDGPEGAADEETAYSTCNTCDDLVGL